MQFNITNSKLVKRCKIACLAFQSHIVILFSLCIFLVVVINRSDNIIADRFVRMCLDERSACHFSLFVRVFVILILEPEIVNLSFCFVIEIFVFNGSNELFECFINLAHALIIIHQRNVDIFVVRL